MAFASADRTAAQIAQTAVYNDPVGEAGDDDDDAVEQDDAVNLTSHLPAPEQQWLTASDAAKVARGTCPTYRINGQTVAVDWVTHYKYRGDALQGFSYVIYRLCIDISALPTVASDAHQAGRRINHIWRFASGHPLRAFFGQKGRSLLACPLHACGRPRVPPPPPTDEPPSKAWLTAMHSASAFYVSNLVPWQPDGAPQPLTIDALYRYVEQLQEAAALGSSSDPDMPHADATRTCAVDGRSAQLIRDSNRRAALRLQDHREAADRLKPPVSRVIAAGRLQLLRNYMHGLATSEYALASTKQMRARAQHRWSDEEKAVYHRCNERDCRVSRDIENLVARQEARRIDPKRIERAQKVANSVDQLQAQLDKAAAASMRARELSADDHSTRPSLSAFASAPTDPAAVRKIADKFNKVMADVDRQQNVAAARSLLNHSQPAVRNTRAELDWWLSLTANNPTGEAQDMFIPLEGRDRFQIEADEWKREFGAAHRRGEMVPLPPLNASQRSNGREILNVLRLAAKLQKKAKEYGHSRQTYSMELALLGKKLHFLLLGPGGTGKSHMMRALVAVMKAEDLGGAVFTAYTGVAVTALPRPAATYCKLTGIPGDAGRNTNDLPPGKDSTTFETLVGTIDRLVLLVLDEISMIGSPHVHHLDRRLQQYLGCTLPFGGLIVIFAGDFHQLKPVQAPALHLGMIADALSADQLADLGLAKSALTDNGADRKGVLLLKTFKRLALTQQMRVQDKAHAAELDHMRNMESDTPPVRQSLLKKMKRIDAAAVREHGEDLLFAKIGVLSNMEKYTFDYSQARKFAKYHGRVFVYWQLPFTGQAAAWVLPDEEIKLRREERAGLIGMFVFGAPGSMTFNYETANGLVNGCDATLHSLTLAHGGSLADYCAAHMQLAADGVWECFLPEPPYSVNVVPNVGNVEKQELLQREVTLDHSTKDGKLWQVVVPILVGERPHKYKPYSVWSAETGIPEELLLKRHEYTLGFAVTDFKVQGRSLDYFVLCIGLRKYLRPVLSITSLYVLLSRVRNGQKLFTLGLDRHAARAPAKLPNSATQLSYPTACAAGVVANSRLRLRGAQHVERYLALAENGSQRRLGHFSGWLRRARRMAASAGRGFSSSPATKTVRQRSNSTCSAGCNYNRQASSRIEQRLAFTS